MTDVDGDWRQARDEYALGRLLDEQDRADWEDQRAEDLGLREQRPTRAQMIEAWARERRQVEGRAELERVAERAVIAQWWRDLYDAERGDE